jgi:zinc D-Ala-D-Ala carboxypeptidase
MPDHEQRSSYPRRTVLRALTVVSVGAGLVTTGATQAAVAHTGPRDLRAGMSGVDVRELQIRVAGWASDDSRQVFLNVSGYFDASTEAAVRRFQQAHGLPAGGVVDQATHGRLGAMATADGSTAHFEWSQFASPDGSGFAGGTVDEATVRENVRRLMYKLEALRHKAGNAPVTINSGFRSRSHNASVGGASNSQHLYGITADIVVRGRTTRQVYVIAETCGFSGLERHTNSWQHVDSRVEYGYGANAWWWESGTVTRTDPGLILPPEPHPTC